MPPLVRKFLVFAAVDALFLQPHVHRSQIPVPGIKISYGKNTISSTTAYPEGLSSLEAHGIVGIFSVRSLAYLVLITKRQQIAQIRGKPIYVISGITIVPLANQAEAKLAIEGSKTETKDDTSDSEPDEPEEHPNPTTPFEEKPNRLGSIAQDVISKKGNYGRFASKWFSNRGWNAPGQQVQDASNLKVEPPSEPDPAGENVPGLTASAVSDAPSVAVALLPKLLRTTRLLLNSQSFYFSYDHDITRRLGSSSSKGTDVPLYKQVDPQFHWNSYLSEALVNAGHHHFVLPVMQGFVSQRAFKINRHESAVAGSRATLSEVIEMQDLNSDATTEREDFLITLISRRSTGRPGLRYLRRGIDDNGNVANFVETEQILSDPAWTKAYSFTQIRGSIPLFFSQSPYSFKPVPVLSHSFETNQAAFRKHFTGIANRYGSTQVALLVDKHGTEAKIGEEYDKHAKHLNEHGGKLGFEWFDFHAVCRGMKFENVSILMDTLDQTLTNYSYTIEENQKLTRNQQGILRTSCMDCLDRTNVVQSACGRWALQQQLHDEGITLDVAGDSSTRWFDIMWADNGDAISKQYASTAALKGDYTRTRKRDYRGALNDFGLTIGRYYNNIVNDFFSQAAIDFLLGRVTDTVFEEFESNMMTADPGMSVSKVRQNAVDISVKIVVEDRTEELRGGWVMGTPHVTNTLRSGPLEEAVLLITDAALYAVRFNWATEKVSAFERVDLKDITRVYRGTYITNTLSSFETDASRNVGFVIEYSSQGENARINTRSMSTSVEIRKEQNDTGEETPGEGAASNTLPGASNNDSIPNTLKSLIPAATSQYPTRILAFKALPSKSGNNHHEPDEGELVKTVCDEIARMAGQPQSWIEEKEVVSLADAKKNTGIIESLGYSLKRLVWA